MLITSCSSGGAGNPTVVRAVQADPPVVGGNDHPAPSDTTADIPVEPFDDPGEPIAIDANVRTGKFVNGLTYYVRDNDNPGGSVELRLAIDAGSVDEDVDQAGVAHFLEHMLFNGTEKYPENELIDTLRGFGADFGADINASTSFDETVYQLTVPTDDPDVVETATDVLAEWLSRATIDVVEVEKERGVVLDEWRSSTQTSDGRMFESIADLFLDGTAYEGRDPIGDERAIAEMTQEPLRRFYDQWYRPDNAAVIAVGDLDADEMVGLLEEKFGVATPRAAAPTEPDRAIVAEREIEARVHPDPDETTVGVELTLPLPAVGRGDTAQVRNEILDALVFDLIARRLQNDVSRGTAPFDSASPSSNSQVRGLDAPSMYLSAASENVDDALVALVEEFRRVELYGFTEAEVATSVASFRAGLDTWYAGRDSVQDADYAQQYVSHFLTGDPIPDEDQAHGIRTDVLNRVSAPVMNWRFLQRWNTTAPDLLVVGPDTADLPTEAEVIAVVEQILAGPVDLRPDEAAAPNELLTPPDPVEEVSSEDGRFGDEIAFLDPVVLTFPNGATVILNETQIVEGSVAFEARSPGGTSMLDSERVIDAPWVSDVLFGSGVGAFDQVQLDQFLAGSDAELSANSLPYVDSMSGSASEADLETLFQLLYLYVTEPRFEQVPLDTTISEWGPIINDPASEPDSAGYDALLDAYYGNDPRFTYLPTPEEFATVDLQGIEEVWRDRTANISDWVFMFSGDFDADVIADYARRYIGPLVGTGEIEAPPSVTPPGPTSQVAITVPAGTGDRGTLTRFSSIGMTSLSVRDRVIADVAGAIINTRLSDTIREQYGESYSPFAAIFVDYSPEPRLSALIQVSGAPDRLDAIGVLLEDNLADLRLNGPSDDEMQPAIESFRQDYDLYSNELLIDEVLTGLLSRSGDLGWIESRGLELGDISAGEVQAFIQQYLPTERTVLVSQVPG